MTKPLRAEDFQRITRQQARGRYNKGEKIYLKTSKVPLFVALNSPWLSLFEIEKKDKTNPDEDFKKVINSFIYYNCCEELGLLVHLYVKSKN